MKRDQKREKIEFEILIENFWSVFKIYEIKIFKEKF
jgi:hypothetical protein